MSEELKREKLKYFVGCPFKDGGRGTEIDPVTQKPFFDCYGLFLAVYREIYGIELPDICVSALDVQAIHSAYEHYKQFWIKVDVPEEPCAVAMSISLRKGFQFINHFGVYIGENKFIHILSRTYSIISRIDEPFYSKAIRGFYVYAG